MREAVIKALLVDPSNSSPVVLLKDRHSSKALPIWIGDAEAMSIAFGLQADAFPRPLPHDLMKSMLDELRVTVERIAITDVRDGTFYASIYLKDPDGREMEIDARPSDSLALALRYGSPIFISEKVFDEAAIESPFVDEEEFQDFVEYDMNLREFRRRAG